MPPVVTVVRPDITEEERQKVLDNFAAVVSQALHCKVTIRKKADDEE
ncbi:MAG: hypothetical protein ABFD25_22680 [Clostridiaceae bacterium]